MRSPSFLTCKCQRQVTVLTWESWSRCLSICSLLSFSSVSCFCNTVLTDLQAATNKTQQRLHIKDSKQWPKYRANLDWLSKVIYYMTTELLQLVQKTQCDMHLANQSNLVFQPLGSTVQSRNLAYTLYMAQIACFPALGTGYISSRTSAPCSDWPTL